MVDNDNGPDVRDNSGQLFGPDRNTRLQNISLPSAVDIGGTLSNATAQGFWDELEDMASPGKGYTLVDHRATAAFVAEYTNTGQVGMPDLLDRSGDFLHSLFKDHYGVDMGDNDLLRDYVSNTLLRNPRDRQTFQDAMLAPDGIDVVAATALVQDNFRSKNLNVKTESLLSRISSANPSVRNPIYEALGKTVGVDDPTTVAGDLTGTFRDYQQIIAMHQRHNQN